MVSASDFDSEYGCSTQPFPAIWLGIARHLHSIYKSNLQALVDSLEQTGTLYGTLAQLVEQPAYTRYQCLISARLQVQALYVPPRNCAVRKVASVSDRRVSSSEPAQATCISIPNKRMPFTKYSDFAVCFYMLCEPQRPTERI